MFENNLDETNGFTTFPKLVLLTEMVLATFVLSMSTVTCVSSCLLENAVNPMGVSDDNFENVVNPIGLATFVLKMLYNH